MCQGAKEPTPSTTASNREAVHRYDMDDRQDFTDARRGGLIAELPGNVVGPDGSVIFDPHDFDFIGDDAEAPDSVEPSLWRQSQLMKHGGLYKVTEGGLYQVRNNDIANLTVIEGEDGIVVVDCMAGVESARQGMSLLREHVTDKPVVAVIYTHTHIDHYGGGVKGVVDAEDVASGKVPIIAPGHQFDKYAIGENVVAGNAMARRAAYAFGGFLESGPKGFLTCGIGIASTKGPKSPTSPPHGSDHRDGHPARDRRTRIRVPLCARHRSPRGDAHLAAAVAGADLRGERQPFAAQHPDAARRPHP